LPDLEQEEPLRGVRPGFRYCPLKTGKPGLNQGSVRLARWISPPWAADSLYRLTRPVSRSRPRRR
jgi:hypothetical protein